MIEKRVEESLILTLIAIGERLKKRREDICKSLGVSTQQWLLLLHLANDPNIPFLSKNKQKLPLMASEIANSLQVSRPNVTNMLNNLIEKELVQQVEDGNDRRRKRLMLTTKGDDLISELQPSRKFFNEQLFKHFSAQEKKQLLDLVERCMETLDVDAL
jgi:DNA-binding MarR family transcriptional regulator